MTTLRMLCWSGYTEILASYAEELAHDGLRIDVYEDKNADAIYARFIAGSNYYDVVVVDWEYRHRYESLVVPLPDALVRLSQYLEPFQGRYWYELSNQLSFVPLRFGTNGLVTRHIGGRISNQTSISDLLSSSDHNQHLGVWDWWLPNLLLLVRAAGFRSPHTITESQLEGVTNGILREFSQRVRGVGRRNRHLFLSLTDIINHELSTQRSTPGFDWILGPSEMIVAPISSARTARNEANSLEWEIPREGGLVWLETAALSEGLLGNRERLSAAYRFLKFLQSPDVQLALICGQRGAASAMPKSYWSYALNNVRGIDAVPKSIRASFQNAAFEQSALEFGRWISIQLDCGALIMRALPNDYECWQQAWEGALDSMAWT